MHISQSSLEKQNIYTHIYANTHNTYTHTRIYIFTHIYTCIHIHINRELWQ